MDEAIQVIKRHFEKEAEYLTLQLSCVRDWANADSLFKKIAGASDKAVVLDYLAELQYGLIFSSLGGTVAFEPFDGIGPDLRVSRQENEFFVEVSRFRCRNSGLSNSNLTIVPAILPEYGNTERDTNKAYGKILEKLEKQCRYGPTVLSLWNDDDELEEEILDACHDIGADSKYPPEVLYVVCKNKWFKPDESQFFLYRASSNPPPFVDAMMANLYKFSVSDAIARMTGVLT